MANTKLTATHLPACAHWARTADKQEARDA